MTPNEAATRLGTTAKRVRTCLRARQGAAPPGGWVIDEATLLELEQSLRAGGPSDRSTSPSAPARVRDEIYVIDLCDELFGRRASRQHRFPWLVGDPGRDGRARSLPVDAYYADERLVVEYRELQHDGPVAFFDKPDRLTVSGVHRGEQRRIYDRRRDDLIPQHGLRLWVITPADLRCDGRGRLSARDHARDLELLRSAWQRHVPTFGAD